MRVIEILISLPFDVSPVEVKKDRDDRYKRNSVDSCEFAVVRYGAVSALTQLQAR
jgi:hypothetical protein